MVLHCFESGKGEFEIKREDRGHITTVQRLQGRHFLILSDKGLTLHLYNPLTTA